MNGLTIMICLTLALGLWETHKAYEFHNIGAKVRAWCAGLYACVCFVLSLVLLNWVFHPLPPMTAREVVQSQQAMSDLPRRLSHTAYNVVFFCTLGFLVLLPAGLLLSRWWELKKNGNAERSQALKIALVESAKGIVLCLFLSVVITILFRWN